MRPSFGAVALLTAALVVFESPARGAQVRIVGDVAPGTPLVFRLEPVAAGDPADVRGSAEVRLVSGGAAELPLPGPGAWILTLRSPGYFAAPAMVSAGAQETLFELRVWPTRAVRIAIEATRYQSLPARVTARFSASDPNDHRFPSGETDCAVDESARQISCVVPLGGPFDLSLHAKGYIGAYAWNLTHRSEAPARPPAWRLTTGGSVVGFVGTARRDLDSELCELELEPVVADLQGSDRAASQLLKKGRSVHPNRRGFFQFEDVSPETYRIRARQAGYSETTVGPLSVSTGEEVRLADPITLVPPFELEVAIEPALDAHQRAWRVQLDRGEPGSSRVTHVCNLETSAQGEARCTGLAPAPYSIRVQDSAGDVWYAERLELTGPGAPLWISLPLIEVSGTVSIGGEPVATPLVFRNPEDHVAITSASGEDGHYLVIVPEKTAPWQVDIGRAGDFPVRALRDVALRPPAGGGRAVRADFDLPGTTLRGRVIDEQQRPARAVVSARTVDDVVSAPTDEEGRFVLRAFTAGRLEIHAQGRAGVSDRQTVVVSEDEAPPDVLLELRRKVHYSVSVLSPDGAPVVGASVRLLGLDAAGVAVDADNGSTDLGGSFDTDVSPAASLLLFYVEATGYPLLIQALAPPENRVVVLATGRDAGVLDLVYDVPGGRPATDFTAHHPTLSLYWRGIELKYFLVGEWAVLNGEPVERRLFPSRVAALPPGHYDACWADHLSRPMPPSPLFGPLPGAQCVGGELVAGGNLTLLVPPFREPGGEKDSAGGS